MALPYSLTRIVLAVISIQILPYCTGNTSRDLFRFLKQISRLDPVSRCSIVWVDFERVSGPNFEEIAFLGETQRDLKAMEIVNQNFKNRLDRKSFVARTKKLSAQCALVISDLGGSQRSFEGVTSLLTEPVHFPLTIRDRDFYIFKTGTPVPINDPDFAMHYKNKIVINSWQKKLTLMSGCLQCGQKELQHPENSNLFPEYLNNLKGLTLRAVVFSGGFASQLRLMNGKYSAFKTGGVALRSFLTAAQTLNFTHQMWPSKMGGRRYPNGTWNGITGDILYKKADLGLVNAISLSRHQAVDFSYIIQYTKIAFVHLPTPIIHTWKSIFWPLNSKLWLALGITTLVSIALLKVLNLYSHDQSSVWGLGKSFEFICASYLLQIPVNPGQSIPVRIYSAFWYLFIIVMTTVYLSKMFGLFVSPPRELAPADFKELADSDYDLHMTYYGGAITDYFRNSANGTSYKRIFRRWKAETILGCHVVALQKPRSACISWDGSTELAKNVQFGDRHGRTDLVMKPSNDLAFRLSIALPKRWIVADQFNKVVSSLGETGFLDLWKAKTFIELREERFEKEAKTGNSTSFATTHSGDEPESLKIQHLTGAFFFFQGGVILGLLVFLGDVLVLVRNQKGGKADSSREPGDVIYYPRKSIPFQAVNIPLVLISKSV